MFYYTFPLRDVTYQIIINCTRLYTFERKRENDRKDRAWRQTNFQVTCSNFILSMKQTKRLPVYFQETCSVGVQRKSWSYWVYKYTGWVDLRFNPLMPSQFFYLVHCLFLILHFIVNVRVLKANSVAQDQTPRSAASDLGLNSLPTSLLWDAKQIWVKRHW